MTARLDWYRRLAATGFSFTVFGIGGVLLTLIAFPLLTLLVRSPHNRKRYAQRLISRSFSGFVAMMHHTGILDYEVHGRERLNKRGCVVVANHPSLIDVVFLISLMPEVDCIVKQALWRNPFTGGPVRAAGYISNSQGPELIEACRASLDAGNRLLVFPEGTRSEPGQPLRFQRGAANIAVHAQADLLPVTIAFNQSTLTKHDRWYHIPREKMHITISVDEPIAVAAYLDEDAGAALAARRLTQDLHAYYVSQLGQAGCLPEYDKPRSAPTRRG